MKKIVIFGAAGMLGHILLQVLAAFGHHLVAVVRTGDKKLNLWAKNKNINFDYHEIDLRDEDSLKKFIYEIKPDIVVNCAVILDEKSEDLEYINSEFPKILNNWLSVNNRLIHISTDAVYLENQKPNEYGITSPKSIYALSKLNGEVHSQNALNIRTSIIGPSLNGNGFYSQLLSNDNIYKAYKNHIFSGITTLELSKIILFIINKNIFISGILNIGSEEISKHTLAETIAKYKNIKKDFSGKSDININRSFNSSKFYNNTGYVIPGWDLMIKDMCSYE
jgi:dTDP-4-dehydrorhamnose reductase